jgi:hypothetical protein
MLGPTTMSSLSSRDPARRERVLVVAAFAVLALLRLATLAPDPWEWDEVLFMEGVRDGLNVRLSHPHAPGYPVFIRLGQAIHALGVEPIRATTLAGALGGFLSAVALYLLLRELGSRRAWALVGALFYALTPSVWLHGVRPLSDGPGAAAALFAALFLVRTFRGRDVLSLFAAAVFTALAAGVRPQVGLALLPAALVAAILVLRRGRNPLPVLAAGLAGVLLSAAIWLPVFRSSGGFAVWKSRMDEVMQYVTKYDTPKPRDLVTSRFWTRWFLDPTGSDAAAASLLLLAVAGAAFEPRKTGPVLLVFVPVTALTLGVLSTDSAPRYALAFWAAPCALAALALERLARSRAGHVFASAAAVLLLGAFAALGMPPIVEVATHESPSVAAMRAVVAAKVMPESVFATGPFRAHVDEVFKYRARIVEGPNPMAIPADGVLVGAEERPFGLTPQRTFSFTDPLLKRITRGRFLRAEIFEGRTGAAVFVPSVASPGWLGRDRAELFEGGALTVASGSTSQVRFAAEGRGEDVLLEVDPGAGERLRVALLPDRPREISFSAVPDSAQRLFVVSVARGHAVLDSFRLVALAPPERPSYRLDDSIPAALDEPAEGARVAVPFRARGWCQELGGVRVDPVEFRLDGVLVAGVRVTRTRRPELAAAVPDIGDTREAGWEALLEPDARPGRHLLSVTLQAGGRRRFYPARAIEIVPGR